MVKRKLPFSCCSPPRPNTSNCPTAFACDSRVSRDDATELEWTEVGDAGKFLDAKRLRQMASRIVAGLLDPIGRRCQGEHFGLLGLAVSTVVRYDQVVGERATRLGCGDAHF